METRLATALSNSIATASDSAQREGSRHTERLLHRCPRIELEQSQTSEKWATCCWLPCVPRIAPTSAVAEAVAGGDRTMHVNQLRFDSLAWMEFSISVELQSGQELTPEDIEHMRYVRDRGVAAREALNMLTTSSRASVLSQHQGVRQPRLSQLLLRYRRFLSTPSAR